MLSVRPAPVPHAARTHRRSRHLGISPAIVEEFIDHDSKEINRLYTHIERAALKKAADALPDLSS
jgi:hypothetical protein